MMFSLPKQSLNHCATTPAQKALPLRMQHQGWQQTWPCLYWNLPLMCLIISVSPPTTCPFYRSFFTHQSTVTFTLSLCTLSPITLTLVITSLPPYWLVLRNDSMMETSNLNITFKSLDIFSPAVSIPSCCSFSWLFLEKKWCRIYF